MIEIIPSILVETEKELLANIAAVSSVVNMVQIDIADGVFVPNTTWAADGDVEIISETVEIDIELHLMVADPLLHARRWEYVPQVKRVLVHYESDPEHIGDILAAIRSYGWNVGLVVNPNTSIDVVKNVTEEIDALMCMGVVPGKQGQTFLPEVLGKISAARAKWPAVFLSLDGGVNEETLPYIIKTNLSAICPGSAVFGNDREPKENVRRMRDIIHRLTNM